ncbi:MULTISPECIES: hypothetical protein [Bacillaceae]|uniref:YfhD family protein n=1 Tax=Metabacillus sediminis TaxID=3117746 RepID=A0ABZ2NMG4_9BACI|nr:hypothetical protein [Bacillus sp. SJS]
MTKRNRKSKSGLQHTKAITDTEFSAEAKTANSAARKSHPSAK